MELPLSSWTSRGVMYRLNLELEMLLDSVEVQIGAQYADTECPLLADGI